MTTIRLIDARRGLSCKCRELFGNESIADEIYRYLCDGLEECENVEPERKTGIWKNRSLNILYPEWERYECSACGGYSYIHKFCPNCGSYNGGDAE